MAIYNGNTKVDLSGISKVYCGNNLIYESSLVITYDITYVTGAYTLALYDYNPNTDTEVLIVNQSSSTRAGSYKISKAHQIHTQVEEAWRNVYINDEKLTVWPILSTDIQEAYIEVSTISSFDLSIPEPGTIEITTTPDLAYMQFLGKQVLDWTRIKDDLCKGGGTQLLTASDLSLPTGYTAWFYESSYETEAQVGDQINGVTKLYGYKPAWHKIWEGSNTWSVKADGTVTDSTREYTENDGVTTTIYKPSLTSTTLRVTGYINNSSSYAFTAQEIPFTFEAYATPVRKRNYNFNSMSVAGWNDSTRALSIQFARNVSDGTGTITTAYPITITKIEQYY